VNGTNLGGTVERAEGLEEGLVGIDSVGRLRRGGQRLRDVRLGGGPSGLQHFVAPFCLPDALEAGWRASAGPGAGRLGQSERTSRSISDDRHAAARNGAGREGGW
jgi:hypothetical protein